MRHKRCLLATLLILSQLALTACRSPETYFYTLSNVVDPGITARVPDHAPLAVGIGPVSVPGYIDRPEIVVRENLHAVQLQGYRHWAEPLASGLPAVLMQNVAGLLPGDRVEAFPQITPTPLDYRVQVEFSRFDVGNNGQATLSARWQVFDGKTRKMVLPRTSTICEQAVDESEEAGVAALSRTVGRLAAEIAEQVAALAGAPHS